MTRQIPIGVSAIVAVAMAACGGPESGGGPDSDSRDGSGSDSHAADGPGRDSGAPLEHNTDAAPVDSADSEPGADTHEGGDSDSDTGADTDTAPGSDTFTDPEVATDSQTDDDSDDTELGPACPVPPAHEAGHLWFSGYESTPWDAEWGLEWDQGINHHIATDGVLFGERAARVTYPAGSFSSQGGAQYRMDVARLKEPIAYSDALYLRYYVRFDEETDFVKGGKLPGLFGGEGNTGGTPSTGFDGWSARIMWRDNGRIVQYVYHADQTGEYGDDFEWNQGGRSRFFIPGKWHCVETYIRMNTVDGDGEANARRDGVVRSWLDGVLALDRTDVRFRYTDAFNVDGLYFSTFFGGGDETWAPAKDEHAMFDNFVMDDERIGCHDLCIIPPFVPPGPDLVEEASATLVFDADAAAWTPNRWGREDSGIVFDSADANHTDGGSRSAYIAFSPSAWDAAYFTAPSPFDPSDHTHVRFWIRPAAPGILFRVQFRGAADSADVTVDDAFIYHSRPFEVGVWQQVVIPIVDFGSVEGQQAIYVRSATDSGTGAFYLDDLALVVAATPASAHR